ncbi:MAG: hypothetical protein WBP16_16030 [Ferruginibacter sp.]
MQKRNFNNNAIRFVVIIFLLHTGTSAFSQSFAINTDGSTANASAILDVKSTAKGLLIPRMTKANRNSIALPAKGLLVFIDDVDSTGFHYYDGTLWRWLEAISSTNAAWKTTGNAGTDTAVNFIGTTDNMPLRFKQNNINIGNWNVNNGNYFIGRSAGTVIATGSDNSYFGSLSNSTVNNIINSTAIGAKSQVDTSNALVLGSISGINTAVANTNVAIGTTKPKAALHISRGSSGSNATIPSSRTLLLEDNTSSYIQFLNPAANESGILAGNDLTLTKAGIIFNPDSSVSIRTGGSFNRMLVSRFGLVGINNTSPQVRLHVNSSSLTDAKHFTGSTAIFENGSTSSSSYLQLMNHASQRYSLMSGTDLTIVRSSISFQPDSAISFETGGFISRMELDKAGVLNVNNRIGINNSVPQVRLHVNSSSLTNAKHFTGSTAIFENGSTSSSSYLQLMNHASQSFSLLSGTDVATVRSAISFQPDSSISFETGGFIERMTILKNGRVGINTNTPAATIDVAGSFKMGTSGTVNSAIIKTVVAINVGLVTANSFLDVDIAVANASTAGAVSISPSADLPAGITIASARVSAAGNVRMRLWNQTGANIGTPLMNYVIGIVQ